MAITINGSNTPVTENSTTTLSNKTLEAPVINNATFTGAQAGLEIKFGNNIVLEGTTDDAYEMTLSGGDPTADRTVTLPDVTGTVITTGNLSAITTVGTLTSNLVFEGTADDFETTLAITDPTADRTITFPDSTGTVALTSDITVTASSANTFTNKSISLTTNTVTASLAELNTAISDADVASLAGSETLTNKTLTSPTVNDSTDNYPTFKSPTETANIVASAATGTINIDVETSTVWYYTSNASANHTLNFRYNSGTTLSSKLAVGESITVVWMNTNGATAYYPNVIQVDGSAVTPKVPATISSGNASAVDVYSFTIIKTAATPTYTVLESQSKFA